MVGFTFKGEIVLILKKLIQIWINNLNIKAKTYETFRKFQKVRNLYDLNL